MLDADGDFAGERRSNLHVETTQYKRQRVSYHAEAASFEEMLSTNYWQGLCSDLHCVDESHWTKNSSQSRPAPEPEAAAAMKERMQTDGYFCVDRSTPCTTPTLCPTECCDRDPSADAMVQSTAEGIALLRQWGWHPLFILVFDEPWLLFSALRPILAVANPASTDFALNWDFMAWFLDPAQQERGWPPHRDRRTLAIGEHTDYMTVWLALSDATPDNGCIYVLPASFDPHYAEREVPCDEQGECAQGAAEPYSDDNIENVQDIRALPCKAGQALCWSGRLLHFGGRCGRHASGPRIALACAVSTKDFEDPRMRIPLDGRVGGAAGREAIRMPSMEERLQAIAVQLWQYEGAVVLLPNTKRLLDALEKHLEAISIDRSAQQ